tara:strand:+ start:1468 stop:1569 length:102 start_codon:yes stop_codon:yes gene_type:complete
MVKNLKIKNTNYFRLKSKYFSISSIDFFGTLVG